VLASTSSNLIDRPKCTDMPVTEITFDDHISETSHKRSEKFIKYTEERPAHCHCDYKLHITIIQFHNHSSPSSAEVKNCGAIPPLPHMSSWRGAWLIKHRDNFYTVTIFYLQCGVVVIPIKLCV
jgi:hypothetical protein